MRKAIVAMIGLAAVGLVQPTVVSAAEGFGGIGIGIGIGGGYPASFGGDNAERGDCRLVAHRVKTRHGWRIRRVQVCS
jgi:hypothetical protein